VNTPLQLAALDRRELAVRLRARMTAMEALCAVAQRERRDLTDAEVVVCGEHRLAIEALEVAIEVRQVLDR